MDKDNNEVHKDEVPEDVTFEVSRDEDSEVPVYSRDLTREEDSLLDILLDELDENLDLAANEAAWLLYQNLRSKEAVQKEDGP